MSGGSVTRTGHSPPAAASGLGLLGVTPEDEDVYRTLLRLSSVTRQRLSEVLGQPFDGYEAGLRRLVALGLVRMVGDVVAVEPPDQVLGQVIDQESSRLRGEQDRLEALRNLVPALAAEHAAATTESEGEVAVQAVEGGDVAALLRRLAEETTGEMRWFRPDQWRLPVGNVVDTMVREMVAAGRRSRAVYPARALEEAPEVLRTRAESGEQVRVVAAVPCRIAVFGETAALVPDRWGANTGRRLVVREHALVGALAALFDAVWERALPVPGYDGGDPTGDDRATLLHQLALGSKDEQIARVMGLSLRTVRRRVADLMEELGAESRFQAGAEAVRRGLL